MPTENKPVNGCRVLMVLHDKKSRFWDSPMTFDSVEMGMRELKHTALNSKDLKGRRPLFLDYPDDFELIHVADYNWNNGDVIPVEREVFQVADIIGIKE